MTSDRDAVLAQPSHYSVSQLFLAKAQSPLSKATYYPLSEGDSEVLWPKKVFYFHELLQLSAQEQGLRDKEREIAYC